jgi:hypothetical protein
MPAPARCGDHRRTTVTRDRRSDVAVGVLITIPELEKEQYDQMNQEMFGRKRFEPADAPEGLLVHTAGPTADGWYVYDVWKSKEDFERFGDEQLTPAAKKVIGKNGLDRTIQYFEIEALVPVMLDGSSVSTSRRS